MAIPSKKAQKAERSLKYMIPATALMSVVCVTIAMSTPNWLLTTERTPISNTTIMEAFLIKKTISGLWSLCLYNISEKQQKGSGEILNVSYDIHMNCSSIEYFVKDRYTSDTDDSTNAVKFAVTKAGPLFVVASIVLGFAVIAAIFGYQRHRRIALFVSGIAFIISGLILLIGLVVYLSALQSEIGQKLRSKNSIDLPQFAYDYGISFILVVAGFMLTELTGILAIFYYIYWHQADWTRKLGSTNDIMNGTNSLNLLRSTYNGGGGGDRSDRSQARESNKRGEFRCHSRYHQGSGGSGYKIMDQSSKTGNRQQQPQLYPSCNAFDHDIPFPPPPPPSSAPYQLSMPRDYTTLTSCSDEEGSVLFPPPPAGSGERGSLGRNKGTTTTTTTV